jgi:glycerol-3-phosphate acyltransferase PlsY
VEYALWVLLGYLFGSFPSGFLLVRLLKGIDIRTVGSGNIGATNVGRCVGRFWAVVVSVADMLKGGFAVLLARALATPGADISWLLAGVGVASVLGHNFPVWLGFRGGKGVSTTYGMLFFLAPPVSCYAVLAGGALWFLLLGIWRYVSLASMLSLWIVGLASRRCMPDRLLSRDGLSGHYGPRAAPGEREASPGGKGTPRRTAENDYGLTISDQCSTMTALSNAGGSPMPSLTRVIENYINNLFADEDESMVSSSPQGTR